MNKVTLSLNYVILILVKFFFENHLIYSKKKNFKKLGHVDLLQILVSSNCGQSVSLADLSEPGKSRVLRDNLIRDDRLKLAMEIATKCRIETEPVWAAWGILKLKMGLYDDAKEKFKHCLGNFILFLYSFIPLFDLLFLISFFLSFFFLSSFQRKHSRN